MNLRVILANCDLVKMKTYTNKECDCDKKTWPRDEIILSLSCQYLV